MIQNKLLNFKVAFNEFGDSLNSISCSVSLWKIQGFFLNWKTHPKNICLLEIIFLQTARHCSEALYAQMDINVSAKKIRYLNMG